MSFEYSSHGEKRSSFELSNLNPVRLPSITRRLSDVNNRPKRLPLVKIPFSELMIVPFSNENH